MIKRREHLQKAGEQLSALGMPVRRKTHEPVPQPTRPSTAHPKKPKRTPSRGDETYDVALSFAGEDRAYVEQVAKLLSEAGVKVFYDRFETARLWGRNLADHLGKVYGTSSRFVVLFISKHYPTKAWPTHERQNAQARAIREKAVILLPARFDDTEIDGLPSTTGYIDLRTTSPAELVALIGAKLDDEA